MARFEFYIRIGITSVAILLLHFISAKGSTDNTNYLKSAVDVDDLDLLRHISNYTELGWDYGCGSKRGPTRWGELDSEWSLCSTGKQQSPIGIVSFETENLEIEPLGILYNVAPATLLNDGNIIRLQWEGGFLQIQESLYQLFEIQFHTPSEHTINGKRYPLEMQMIHRNRVNDAFAVVSVLFKMDGEHNKFLDQFWQYLPALKVNQSLVVQKFVDPEPIKLNKRHFYWYSGSLTSPPCTEGVLWIVMKKIHALSHMQLNILAESLQHENARPMQSTNGRIVYKRSEK